MKNKLKNNAEAQRRKDAEEVNDKNDITIKEEKTSLFYRYIVFIVFIVDLVEDYFFNHALLNSSAPLRGCEKIEIQSSFAKFFASFKISSPSKTTRGTFRSGMKFEICKKISSKALEF